jgi:putative ABC transport system permease protein
MFLRLAWRNVWKNSRRSLLTILAVLFATMLSVVMRGMQLGTYEVLITNMVKTYIGFLQIQTPEYQKNPSLRAAFVFDESMRTELMGQPGVVGLAPRIQADGLVSFGEQSQGAMILGLVPEQERLVSRLHTKVLEGSFLADDTSKQIVIGYKLLKNLNANVGDRVVLLAQGFDGSLGNDAYTIVGSLKTGTPEFDGMAIFMGLRDARALLGMTTQVHVVALALDHLSLLRPAQERIQHMLNARNLKVLTWNEVSPELMRHIELDNVSGILMLAVLIVIVAFGILNTVLMSVTERFREFGVMLSMGMRNGRLVLLVLGETAMITLVGILVGDAIAWCINYYIMLHPIAIAGLESISEEFGLDYRLFSTVQPSVFVNSSVAVLGISLMMTLYPAYRVSKLEPLRGLRFT